MFYFVRENVPEMSRAQRSELNNFTNKIKSLCKYDVILVQRKHMIVFTHFKQYNFHLKNMSFRIQITA